MGLDRLSVGHFAAEPRASILTESGGQERPASVEGVIRAIGATAAAVVGVFVVEGVLVGVLSWLLALPLNVPGAYSLSSAGGQAIVQIPLDLVCSTNGALLWLLIVVPLSALASLWPALRATRVSVRESLAYE